MPKAYCADCDRLYGSASFQDFVIPDWAWKEISPTGDEGGLLCACCICARLKISGIVCEGAFTSGPIVSVTASTMTNIQRAGRTINEPVEEGET